MRVKLSYCWTIVCEVGISPKTGVIKIKLLGEELSCCKCMMNEICN